jgi:hypothetical protein
MKSRKAQEEMVGFVLIMLIVAVIFLVFLTIFVRRGITNTDVESLEVSHFLDSILEYTTDCSLDQGVPYTYLNVGDLFRECTDNNFKNCVGYTDPNPDDALEEGQTTCEILSDTIERIIENDRSWGNFDLKEGSQYSGYSFDAVYDPSDGAPSPVFDKPISKACPGSFRRGSDKPVYAQGGRIIISLTLCR